MYHQHWRLSESPFRNSQDPRRIHASPGHEEALARLHFLADERRRMGLLLAGAGCGKSLLLETFAREMKRGGRAVVRTSLLGLSLHDFLWRSAAAFGLNPADAAATFQLWRQVVDHLSENRCQGIHTLFLLDDADEASAEVLAHVVRLAQCDPTSDSQLTIVLAADPLRLDRLGPRLVDLVDLRIDIPAWDEHDTADYVRGELRRVGAEAEVFSDEALARLHHIARGVPRRVNQLADLALLAGAGRDLALINAETISAVHTELGLGDASLARA
jgi:type II secretory pathway predicted ATPase ExeA